MKKNHPLKKCLALLLAVSLLGSQISVPSITGFAEENTEVTTETETQASTTAQTTASTTAETTAAETQASTTAQTTASTAAETTAATTATETSSTVTESIAADVISTNSSQEKDASAGSAQDGSAQSETLQSESIQSETATPNETLVGSGNENGTSSGTGTDTDTQSESETSETELAAESETETETETDSDIETESDMETESETESESETTAETEELQIKATLKAETETETETVTEAENGEETQNASNAPVITVTKENTYTINVKWEISGTSDESVQLALCMDEITYDSLLNSCAEEVEDKANKGEYYCRIQLNDSKNTVLTLKKTYIEEDDELYGTYYARPTTKEPNPIVRLVYEQIGDTDAEGLEWEFTIEAASVEEDTTSMLLAQWYKEAEEDANAETQTEDGSSVSEEENEWKTLGVVRVRWSQMEEETESETEEETETESGTEIETESETETESESDTEAESESETESENSIEVESEYETEFETEIEYDTDTETEVETETDTEAETDVKSETEIETEVGYVGVTASLTSAEPVAISEDGDETESEKESESESETADVTTVNSVDLSAYLTGTDAEVDSDTNAIMVSLSYKINTSVLQEAGTNIVTYQIPDNISAKKEYSGSVMDGNTVVGSYTISTDGLITIVFNEDYVNGTPADITGSISFWARTSQEEVGDDDTLEIVFNDEYTITVKIDKTSFSDFDVTVDKSCTDTVVDKENAVITFYYKVEITTVNGTGTTLNFDDILSNQLDKAEYSELSITKYNAGGNEVSDFDGSTVAIVAGTASTDPSLSGTLPSLDAGEKYVVTYTVTRTLNEDEDGAYVSNTAKVSNTYTGDIDYSSQSASLYDLSVKKTSADSPVLDREAGTVTNVYQVTVSTTLGTKDEIDLSDKISFWSNDSTDDFTYDFTVSSITKYTTDTETGEVISSAKLDLDTLDMNGDALEGTLPALEAGEYYTIEYTAVLSGLPEDSMTTFSMMNSVSVSDGANQQENWDSDYITWVGSGYVNWISKTGTYNASSNTITWKIVLNEGGYGDLNGMKLSDILSQNGVDLNDSIQISISEKIDYTEYPYTGTFTLPYTFTNGVEVSTWGGSDTLTVDTTHEFIITYTTTVDNKNVDTFFNTYTNTAKIGEHEATAEVSIAENELNKTFTGSTPYTESEYEGGYVLSWQTAVDIPKNGLAKGSYYTDEISDSSSGQQNNKNWFTVSLLNDMNLSVDGTDLSKDDYTISCTGTTASGTAFTDVTLSEVESGSIISAYKITFNKAIIGKQLVIKYSSYSSTTDLAYNTGTYTVGEDTVSDEASGKGDDGTLVSKYNADGSTALKKELADIQDTNLDGSPYLLTYKLVINENNSASGAITITDTLPKGASLYTSEWKYSTTWDGQISSWPYSNVFEGGVYFFYQPYDEKNYSYAYSNTSENTTRIAYFSDRTVYGKTVLDYDVTVSYDGDSRTLTITIPEAAYLDSTIGTNHTMVLYYAVEIDPSVMEGYEYDFENKVEVTSTTGLADDNSLTDTLVSSSVEKKGSYNDTTNSVSYEVYINPEGVKVADSGGTLKIHDTFAFTARSNSTWNYYIEDVNLLPDSLKLWKQTEVSGLTAWVDCSDEIISYSLEVPGHYAYLTVEVPDGEYYKLTYSYVLTYSDEAEEQISSADGLSLDVTNTVKIDGLGSMGNSTSDTTGIEANGSQASASKGYANITLYKRDSENELLMLEGAEFELERYDGTSWVSVKNEDSSTFITDADGKVQLGDKLDESTYRISYNFLYRLREVKAPEGYTILSDYMYFYVASDDNSTIVGPDGWETSYKNKMLTVVNDAYIFVDNEAQDEDTTAFAIRKVWQDASGNMISSPTDSSGQSITSVTVDLYKKVGDSTSKVTSVYLKPDNDWSALVENLPVYENSELIYYYVEETVPSGWTFSYSNDGGLISADTTDTQIVVTNTELSDDTVSASVSKTWLKADGTEYTDAPEDSVTVTLKRSYTIPGTAAVVEETDEENNVTASSNEMVTITVEVTDGTGTETKTLEVAVDSEVKIYIESPGFSHLEGITTFSSSVSPTYTWTTAERTIDNENVWVSCEALTFYATEDTTVTIGNEWATYSMNTLDISTTGNTVEGGETITDAGFSKTITLSDANNWSYSWGALPKCSSYGTEYTYWIEEIAPSGYYLVETGDSESSYKVVASEDTDGNMTFAVKNMRVSGIDTSIAVKKKWQYSDGTEITAEDPASELLSSAELMLYRSTEKTQDGSLPADAELVDTAQVTKSADWTYTWNYLDKYADNDTKLILYYYYVVEASTGELYEASYSGNGVNETTNDAQIVVTNIIKTTEISVKKTWLDADGNEKTSGNPGSVVVQLYRKADEVGKEDTAYGEAVTLGTAKSASENNGTAPDGYSDDGWTYNWANLLLGDYYVVETALEGFSTSYEITVESNTEPDPGAGVTTKTENYTNAADAAISSGTITVKNQEIPVEITVTKQWGTGVTEIEVDVQLYRSTSRPAKTVKTVTVYQQNGYGTQTLLQAKQIDTDYLTLMVESSSWGSAPSLQCTTDQKVVVGDATDSGTSYSFDVSNITTDITLVLYTNATASKTTISNALPSLSTGDSGLLSAESADEEKVSIQGRNDNSVTLSTENNWTYTWSDLPRVNEDGEIYYYYVKETTTSSSFESSYSYIFNEDGSIDGVTILNTTSLTTSIKAQKKWVDSQGNEKTLTDWSVTLNLYRKNADGEWELYALDSEKTITNDTNNATVQWENLPAGEYYVGEVSMNGTAVDASNYTATYANAIATNASTEPENASTMGASDDGADIVITNTEGSTEISVAKKWTDGSSNHTGESVTMNLYASTTDPATAESASQAVQGKTVTVTYSGGNKFDVSGIVLGDAVDIKIYYQQYQYTNGGINDSTLTKVYLLGNSTSEKIYPNELVVSGSTVYILFSSVDISNDQTFTYNVDSDSGKEAPWPQDSGHEITDIAGSNYEFDTYINPASAEDKVGSVELNSSNKWTSTWTDLPLTNASGEKLYYYVEEKTLSNCSTSYSYTYNTDGSISKVTVTNRPVSGDTSIAITKKWVATDGETLTPGDGWAVTVQLFVKSSTGDWEEYKDANNQIVTKELRKTNSWTDTFTNLPNGEYYVKEISMSGTDLVEENYTATYQINTQTASENAEEVSTSGGGTITITNTETPTSLSVSKAWVDENGTDVTDSITDGSVQMTIYSSTTKPDVVESGDNTNYYISVERYYSEYDIKTFISKAEVNSSSAKIVLTVSWCNISSADGYKLTLLSGSEDTVIGPAQLEFFSEAGTSYITFMVSNISSDCVFDFNADINNYSYWPTGGYVESVEVATTNPVGEWVSVGVSSLPADVTISSATYVGTVSLTPSNDWTYTWDDLPTHDASGNQLYYYIVEDACAGYTTSYEHYYRDDGTIEAVRVTNSYDTDAATTEIGVVKDWEVSDTSSVLDYKVTVQLWKHKRTGTGDVYEDAQVTNDNDGNTISEVTLTSENNWSGIWKNLTPISDSGEYYFVKEVQVIAGGSENTDVTDNYIVTYANNERTTSGTVQITNTEKTEISVTKQWKETNSENKVIDMSEGDCPDSISVTLWRVVTSTLGSGTTTTYEEVETVEMGKAYVDRKTGTGEYDNTGWKYTWTSLPAGTYYVVESGTNSSEYTTTYLVDGDEEKDYGVLAKVRTGNITITNTAISTGPETIDVTVNKKWVYSDDQTTTVTDETLLPESVTFALYYSTVSPVTLESEGKTFPEGNDLVAYDPETEGSAETEVVKADGDGNWTCKWTNLPKYSDDGSTLYYYYVKEICIDEKEITTTPDYENNGSTGDTNDSPITVTNTVDTTSVTVKKSWRDASGAEINSDVPSSYTVTLQLYQWDEDGGTANEGAWVTYGDAIILSSDSAKDSTGAELERNSSDGWTYTWTHLPAGKYYVEETGTTASGGFTVSYRYAGMTETTADLENAEKAAVTVATGSSGSSTGTITVINKKESTQISVEKIWKNSDGTTDTDQSETVKMYLYRTTTPLTEAQTDTDSGSEQLEITSVASNGAYAIGTSGGTSIICSGAYSEFESVEVDGTTVDSENYTVSEGSTIILFTQDYLDSLGIGEHTVILHYSGDRSVSAILTIIDATEPNVTTETENFTVTVDWGNNTAPTTGSVTASIYSCDSNGSDTSSEAIATLTLSNESNWSGTVALTSATLTDGVVTDHNYYKVIITETSIQTDGGMYTVKATETIISKYTDTTATTVSGTYTETEASTVSLTVTIDSWIDTDGKTTTDRGGWIWVQLLDADNNYSYIGGCSLSNDNPSYTFDGLSNGYRYQLGYNCSSAIASKQWQYIQAITVTGSSIASAESGSTEMTLSSDSSVGLTVTYGVPATASVTFSVDTSEWDSSASVANGYVSVAAYAGDAAETDKPVYSGTLNADNSWTVTTDTLYWGSDASYEVVYGYDGTVITSVSGNTTLAGSGDTAVTLTATLADSSGSGDSGDTGDEETTPGITVAVTSWMYGNEYSSSGDAEPLDDEDASINVIIWECVGWTKSYTVTLSAKNGWKDTVAVEEGKYAAYSDNISYSSQINGFKVTTSSEVEITSVDDSMVIELSVYYDAPTASAALISKTHTLTLSSGTESEAGATTTTTSETKAVSNQMGADEASSSKCGEITLGTSNMNGLSYTWSNLDRYDENGNLYYYYIVEESLDGYTSTYSNNVTVTTTEEGGQVINTVTTIDKVIVTNTKEETGTEPVPDTISVTVKKMWENYSAGTTNEYDDYTVLVKLTKDKGISGQETELYQILLGKAYSETENYSSDGWSYTWSGLESDHTYTVEEVAVYAKYGTLDEQVVGTTTYSTAYTYVKTENSTPLGVTALTESGTVTITNTKTSSQGIVMPGTGSKYSIVFYGLGLSFLVMSATWMLYAFKKKKYKYAGKGGVKPDSS